MIFIVTDTFDIIVRQCIALAGSELFHDVPILVYTTDSSSVGTEPKVVVPVGNQIAYV